MEHISTAKFAGKGAITSRGVGVGWVGVEGVKEQNDNFWDWVHASSSHTLYVSEIDVSELNCWVIGFLFICVLLGPVQSVLPRFTFSH